MSATPTETAARPIRWLDWFRRHFFLATLLVVAVLFFVNQLSRQFFSYSSDAYMTTDTVTLAPAVAGLLATVNVRDNQVVKAGDVLFALDQAPFQYALELADANVKIAQADLKGAKDSLEELKAQEASAQARLADATTTAQRISALTERGVATQQRLDDLRRNVATLTASLNEAKAAITVGEDDLAKATAAVDSANAARSIAQYNLSQSTISAPRDGFIAPFTAKPGDYLDVGDAVMTLVADDAWRIVVNLLEQHLAHTEPGNTVYFMLSSQPWRIYEGRVESLARGISRAPVDTSTLPYVAPTTEWIRLSRRFPIEIDVGDLPGALPLYMGSDARVLILH